MRYYIADLHFFHKNLNDRLDKRGFKSVEEMNEYMIKQWNSRVRKNDEVIVIGDLSFGKGEETNSILRRLNGKIFLIKGNHDHSFLNDPKFDRSLIGWVKDVCEMNDNGRKVILHHYPVLFYNGQYRVDKNGKPTNYMLYGHIHDTQDMRLLEEIKHLAENFTYTDRRSGNTIHGIPMNVINCFCMYSDYIPLTLDEWIAKQKA